MSIKVYCQPPPPEGVPHRYGWTGYQIGRIFGRRIQKYIFSFHLKLSLEGFFDFFKFCNPPGHKSPHYYGPAFCTAKIDQTVVNVSRNKYLNPNTLIYPLRLLMFINVISAFFLFLYLLQRADRFFDKAGETRDIIAISILSSFRFICDLVLWTNKFLKKKNPSSNEIDKKP